MPWERRISQPPKGVQIHRVRGLEARTQWNTSPPRVRLEDAVLDCATAAPTEFELVATLANACGSRRTTAGRLLRALDDRAWISNRDLIAGVLKDIAEGANSVLEHAYLTRVERAHGLPRSKRQKRVVTASGVVYRDNDYEEVDLLVEIDGVTIHNEPDQRARDLDRDLDAAIEGQQSVRLDAKQVTDEACSTAAKLATLMQLRGWTGRFRRCPCCP